MAEKKNKFPITHRDWLVTIRHLPDWWRWIVLALIVGLVIKALFFE